MKDRGKEGRKKRYKIPRIAVTYLNMLAFGATWK